ncbi:MAG TPA: hypothetical protein PK397_06950 [Ignavibacteriaceae bacterium]|nr:hypothetical protein [Ignavibacteriaceae bacterium]
MPYGCKGLGFKSLKMPAYEVFAASGRECLKFTKKPGPETPGKKYA